MRIRILLTAALLLMAALTVPQVPAEAPRDNTARAGDYDEWPTFHGDNARSGNTTGYGPGTNKMLWSNNTGRSCYGSPVVAGGRVFIGSQDMAVYCFNATTGERLWRTATTDDIWSTPAVDPGADRVYIGSNDHYLYCLNATTGAQVWSTQVGGVVTSAPLIYNDKIIFGCGDWYLGPADGYLYCLYASNGTQYWRTAGAGSSASPALADGRLFSQNGNQLRCLNPDTGAFIWNASITTGYHGSPAAADGRVFYNGGNGHIFCFNASGGSKLWETNSGYVESESTPAISNGSVYACVENSDGQPGALKKMWVSNGTVEWTYPTTLCPWGSPAVTGDRVYFSYDRTILCLKTSDKSVVWSYQGAAGDFYGIGGSPALAYGRLYLGGAEAKLYCFGASGPNFPPASVTLAPAESVTTNSLALRWTRNADSDFARYEVHRSLTPDFVPGPLTLVQTLAPNTQNFTSFSGLNYSTTYHFKVRVWDGGDPPLFNTSNEISVTTLTPNGAPAAVTVFLPSEITPFTMKLSWSANTDSDFAKYELHKGITSTFSLSAVSIVSTINTRDQNSSTVTGLKPWTTYYFKVRVWDNASTPLQNVSNTVSALTGNTPPAAVALNPVQMGATNAYLTWMVSSEEDFAFYEIHMSRNTTFTPGSPTVVANISSVTVAEYTIEDLTLAKNYYFRIRVHDEGGLFNDSNTVNGTTANTVPKPVISSPSEGDQFDTRTLVFFDGANSTDQDLDALNYYWTSSVDGFLSKEKNFSKLLTIGSHRITLFVDDGNGHNVSAKLNINIVKAPDRAPGLWLLSHRNNDDVAGLIKFAGTAWDIDGNETLAEVQIKIEKADWKKVTGTTNWTYDWNVSKLANGKQKINFRVFDGELYSPEQSITVVINNINLPPTVGTMPMTNKPFSRQAVITGTAADPEGNLVKVEMSVNGGGWFAVTGTTNWTYTLDVSNMKNSPHSLMVRAFDGVQYSENRTFEFTVKNAGTVTPQPTTNYTPFIAIGVVVALVAVIGAVMMMRRKKAVPAAPPVGQQVAAPPAQQYQQPPQQQYAPPQQYSPDQYQQPPQEQNAPQSPAPQDQYQQPPTPPPQYDPQTPAPQGPQYQYQQPPTP